jgi:hypothetical protein
MYTCVCVCVHVHSMYMCMCSVARNIIRIGVYMCVYSAHSTPYALHTLHTAMYMYTYTILHTTLYCTLHYTAHYTILHTTHTKCIYINAPV